ncbi:hypothetical protein BEP19_06480 [Ammoniphilus oxalaticus]|uniref:Uncharacterized protein n=1 Tax=Ammoniphilus oxalaticus TaxID=66863 RepID=A0A419SJ48_9BACL|nr:hypothetical protein [Ammoniphilus oxalaticus]RKD24051.1 hypothetical protein BEP19_06480 [Ammoniphilus oxalaticus]
MIKSFFKRVFSSGSDETAVTPEQQSDAQHLLEAGDQGNAGGQQAGLAADEQDGPREKVTIRREWLEPPNYRELYHAVTHLYEQASQTEAMLTRLKLQLADNLQNVDVLTAKRVNKYLSKAEHDIVDLTYFLDKTDQATMDIYREFLLPERIEQLNLFLQERCLMIYETSKGLGTDYKAEIEQFFDALDMTITPTFFDEFEQWREEVLKRHAQEEQHSKDEQEQPSAEAMLKISKEEVENENIQQIDHYLKQALQSPEIAREMKGTLLFSFYGFSKHEDLLKLMNRKEVNDWASLLVEQHPYIFYFLNNLDYPMTQFLTSLVVTTEIEDSFVYYNDDELTAFKAYIVDALEKLADWVKEDKDRIVLDFTDQFQ